MDFQYVILAAGKGKRMGNPEVPKVLNRLHNRPLISYLLQTIHKVPSSYAPVVVVGYKAEEVQRALGEKYTYALQTEQLGTGHAVMAAKEAVTAPHIAVLFGDTPFIKSGTLKGLLELHAQGTSPITMATVTVPDFEGWRDSFLGYGRIIRSESGAVLASREYKDATEEERAIREVNPGMYIFQTDWLFEQLGRVGNVNAQGEYYLTDVVALALSSGHVVPTLPMDPQEALGINTVTHLEHAQEIIPNTAVVAHELILE